MAESYKLTYFNVKAVAEPIRLVFAYTGVKYEDIRIPHEGWPDIKKNYPYGQLPVLEVNGQILAQSNAICRYLARKYNLHGSNDWEAAKIDEIADSIIDFRKEFDPVHREQDATRKAELKKNFVETVVPKYYNKLDAMVASNQAGPYLVGKSMSWVDIMISHYFDTFKTLLPEFPNILDSYPNLKKLQNNVYASPGIKEWIAKRPESHI